MNKTEQLSARFTIAELKEIDAAANALELNRSEWLKIAIARQLGKRPKLPLAARMNAIEQRLDKLAAVLGQ